MDHFLVPGEQDLLGKGVSYRAFRDGEKYRGKTIAIIITDPRFEPEANYLSGLAEKVVLFTGYKGCSVDLSHVIFMGTTPASIEGRDHVEAIRCTNGMIYAVDGVFCLQECMHSI